MINFIKKRYKLLIIILFIILGIVIAYPKISQGQNGKKQETAKVILGNLEEKLTISGSIDAQEKVTLRFQTSGRLAWIGVKEGDYVKKFQTIASLDQREIRAKLNKYLNDYLKERNDFDQTTKDDYKDKVITDAVKRTVNKAQLDLNNTVADVEIQNLTLELSNLWTPIEGIITKIVSPFAGVNITPAQAEFEVVNPKTIYFIATADQTEVVKLKENMEGELVLDAYPEKTIKGSLKNISFGPKSGETGVVYSIKFVFNEDNSNYQYRLGMAGDLSFTTKRKDDVLYLPSKFIKEEKKTDNGNTGTKYVQIKEKDKIKKVYVETGMETDDHTEITSGIPAGETVYY